MALTTLQYTKFNSGENSSRAIVHKTKEKEIMEIM